MNLNSAQRIHLFAIFFSLTLLGLIFLALLPPVGLGLLVLVGVMLRNLRKRQPKLTDAQKANRDRIRVLEADARRAAGR